MINRYWRLSGGMGLDHLHFQQGPIPTPGPGEVLVRMRAAALNYRDLLTLQGGYGSKQQKELIPLSDGAGVVEAVGTNVDRFQVGDRVTACFFQNWQGGEPSAEKFASALGGLLDGTLAEYRIFSENGLVRTPAHLSDVEAATLTCAGLTAWSALVTQGQVRPGDTVLVQGTGGVSLFALQFAKLCGARIILTSSSDEKLRRGRALGADETINYKTTPEWARTVRAFTQGKGCDHVIEIGGAGTLQQSIRAVRVGGIISMIGVLGGATSELTIPLVVTTNIRLQGVTVGARDGMEAMCAAIAQHQLHPVIDKTFLFEEAKEAFAYMTAGAQFGKITIAI